MVTDAAVGFIKLLDKLIFNILLPAETKFIDHLFMPAHIRARHYMCCKRHLHADDFGKQTVW